MIARGVLCATLALACVDRVRAAGGPDLVDAAKRQDTVAVRALVEKGTDVNVAAGDGATALHWAAHWNDISTLDLLLEAGANTNAANAFGVTALSLACTNGAAAAVDKLLAAGADPNIAQATGETPLMTCARAGNAEAVTSLLAHGADVNAKETLQGQTALMWASGQNHADVVQALVDAGAHVYERSDVRPQLVTPERNRFGTPPYDVLRYVYLAGGSTALHFAARNGAIEAAEVLLSAEGEGGKLDMRRATSTGLVRSIGALALRLGETAADGTSALVIAIQSGHTAFARFLLEKGANPNADAAGYAPLHVAVLRGDVEIVRALLKHGATPDIRLTRGTPSRRLFYQWDLPWELVGATPYFQAAKYAEVEIMQELAAAGADPTATDGTSTTPLMAAAGVGWMGSDYWDRRGRNLSQEVLAAEREDEPRTLKAVAVALEHDQNINAQNIDGDTALHGAAAKGYTQVMQLLVDRGADASLKNNAGRTAADVLKRSGYKSP